MKIYHIFMHFHIINRVLNYLILYASKLSDGPRCLGFKELKLCK